MENLKKGICKICKIKSNCFEDSYRNELLKPKLLNSKDICIFCENESKGIEPSGHIVKNFHNRGRHGTEIFSKMGYIDENRYLSV